MESVVGTIRKVTIDTKLLYLASIFMLIHPRLSHDGIVAVVELAAFGCFSLFLYFAEITFTPQSHFQTFVFAFLEQAALASFVILLMIYI